EGNVLELIAIEQITPFRGKPMSVRIEHAVRIEPMPRVPFFGEMIDERPPVRDARALALDQMRKIVVLLQPLAGLVQNLAQLTPQRSVLNAPDLAREIDLAVPDFQRGELGQTADERSVGFGGGGCDGARAFVGKSRQRRYRDA